MTMPKVETTSSRVRAGLRHDSASVRLRSALAAGSDPDPEFVEALVERCAVEPVFHVRDMLTWALTRHPADLTVPRVVAELRSPSARARSQALHTLSKIGDRGVWPAITRSLLTDADDEVARTAWRTAALLVPEGEVRELAEVLVSQLGRGGRETHLSLSRALIALGEPVAPLLREAASDPDPGVRGHALATERLWKDPDAGFSYAVEEAKRVVSLGPEGQEALDADGAGAGDADGQEYPGADGQEYPGADGPEAVGADRLGMPGADGPEAVGADGLGTPGENGPEVPGADGPEVPGADGPEVPGADGPEVPGADGPEVPGADGQGMPGENGPEVPGTGGMEVPGAGGPGTPGESGP